MPIVNRELDVSEKRLVLTYTKQLAATSLDLPAHVIPYPCKVVAVRATARGLSGAPAIAVRGQLLSAAGSTILNASMMQALTVPAFGTSGVASASLAAGGSTLLNLSAGQVLVVTTSGANTASDDLLVEVVLEKLQDIVSFYGV